MEGEELLDRHFQLRITLLRYDRLPYSACDRRSVDPGSSFRMDSARLFQPPAPTDRFSGRSVLALRRHRLGVCVCNLLRHSLPRLRTLMVSQASLSHHPAPQRDRVSSLESLFGLIGGPAAWFIQLCAGYTLASWPCFPMDERRMFPLRNYNWTFAAIVAVSIGAVLL